MRSRPYFTVPMSVSAVGLGLFSIVLLMSAGQAQPPPALPRGRALYYGWQPSHSSGRVTPFTHDAQGGTAAVVIPEGVIVTVADVNVRFFDPAGMRVTGRTRPGIIARELELDPGDAYDPVLAAVGLQRINALDPVGQATLTLEPGTVPGEVLVVVNVVEQPTVVASLNPQVPPPSALQGPFQPRTVDAGVDQNTGTSIGGRIEQRNLGGHDQDLAGRLLVGERVLSGEVRFTDPWIANDPNRTGYRVNLFNQRSVLTALSGGDPDVDLATDDNPWVHRMGAGVEFFRPVAPETIAAVGATYQRVSVRNSALSDRVFSTDELGNPLTLSDSGQDDLLTLNARLELDRRDQRVEPTRGTRIRLGVDQSIPLGDANILLNRLSANYLEYIPFPWFGFAPGPQTLVINLQGGTLIGDAPPYEAFNIGSDLVRGFRDNNIGTGRSFILATTEYRFPITSLRLLEQGIDLGGTLFVDYASDLGSGDTVLGEPAVVRGRAGDAFGYGIGVRASTPFGLFRAEFGISGRGESEFIFTTGDRF